MQGIKYSIEKVSNGFIIRGHDDNPRTLYEVNEQRVARSGSEVKAELTEMFNNFLNDLDLT